MFTSGSAQRQGLRSAQYGLSGKNIISTIQGAPHGERVRQNDAVRTTKRKRHALIGAEDASGLVIQGTHDLGHEDSTQIDDAKQDFPISFSGLGVPKFTMPIRVPTIDGNLHVNGSVYASNIGDQQTGTSSIGGWYEQLYDWDFWDTGTLCQSG